MEIIQTSIPGCYEMVGSLFLDSRGSFLKTYHDPTFSGMNLCSSWKEEYYSVSGKGVLRGMHFQTPPEDHFKQVFCLQGEILDVVVDLRLKSPTYGKCVSFMLNPKKGNMVYIEPGFAHGFLSLQENTIVYYRVSTVYSPENDKGILWSSIDFEWPIKNPILSSRDNSHPALSVYKSPFKEELQ